MKSLCVAVLLAGCITINSGSSEPPENPDGDGGNGSGSGSGSGSGDGDGVIGDPCSLQTSAGPHGSLADFDVAPDGTRWMLTYPDDENAPADVWVNAGSGWVHRPIDVACMTGFLQVDAQGRAHVVCNVWELTGNFYTPSIRHATVTTQTATSEAIVAVTIPSGYSFSQGGLLVSAQLDPNGKPAVVWLEHAVGNVSQSTKYRLSQFTSGFWSVRELMDFDIGSPGVYAYNDQARVFFADGEPIIGYRDSHAGVLHFARPPASNGSSMDPLITVASASGPLEELGFSDKYQLVRDSNGTFHIVVYDSPSSGPGTLTYYQQSGSSLAGVGPTPEPVGPAGAGLSLALAPGDMPIISYYAASIGGIRLSAFDGTTWAHEDVDTTGVGHRSRVRFDASGHLHVAYQDVATGGVRVVDEVCP